MNVKKNYESKDVAFLICYEQQITLVGNKAPVKDGLDSTGINAQKLLSQFPSLIGKTIRPVTFTVGR